MSPGFEAEAGELSALPANGANIPLYRRPALRLGLGLCFGLGALWLAFDRLRSHASPLPEGPPEAWTKAEQKQAVAEALKEGVRLPGFKVWIHKVAQGENFWGLAKGAGVNIDTVVGLNPDLKGLQAKNKQALLLANQSGALYISAEGDSVESIEAAYKLAPGALRSANHLGPFGLGQGRALFLPGAKPQPRDEGLKQLYAQREVFRSPLKGRYTSLVGARLDPFTGDKKHHNGVDIKAPYNDLVAAAAEGVVTSAGWNGGLGKAIRLRHSGGYETVYGHLNSILVKPGQHIKQHQFIGRVGSTGRTTGAHLHFTIYKNGKVQDPLKYLW